VAAPAAIIGHRPIQRMAARILHNGIQLDRGGAHHHRLYRLQGVYTQIREGASRDRAERESRDARQQCG
jgi:hypothetical protein